MKKLLFIAVASSALVAVAEYTSQTIGVTEITTTNANTIISVPFASLNGGGNISANDLVCTNGLEHGTALHVFKDNTYYSWALDRSAGWVPAPGTSQSSEVVIANSDVACGGAIWIVLPGAPSTPKSIFIYGDFSTPVATSSLVSGKDNLVANPLQSKATITVEPAAGDIVTVTKDGLADKYEYKQNKSKTLSAWRKDGASVDGLPQIEVGQGIWYHRAGANTSITWTAVPAS